jgi:hypothetical protein
VTASNSSNGGKESKLFKSRTFCNAVSVLLAVKKNQTRQSLQITIAACGLPGGGSTNISISLSLLGLLCICAFQLLSETVQSTNKNTLCSFYF